ncbi:hypothetical protein BC834DRAFT_866172 [Gloeopeniophorella convolvens]|nr:hypothetical protein BC834DRAFT_866172 [Gloeopeniophorella convolvens]
MRIRISTLEQPQQALPVPQVKSWFNIDNEASIARLKESLCNGVPALRDADIPARELALSLDDFELLDDSAISVLRENDLVCLSRRSTVPKRKVDAQDDAPRKRQKHLSPSNAKVIVHDRHTPQIATKVTSRANTSAERKKSVQPKALPPPSSSESESSTDTSSDDDTSSADSSPESDSDSSDSESSDTSSTKGAPRPQEPFSTSSQPANTTTQPTSAPVPPGFGKPQTRARNERRRKKRTAGRTGAATSSTPAASANAVPLGAPKPVSTPTPVPAPEPMMMSLKNKNKRRGFKRTADAPAHITFQDDGADGADPAAAPVLPTRLVPPSERTDLPPRLFVTSVDVEAGLWSQPSEATWDRKRKKKQRDAYGHEEEQNITLNYDDVPDEGGVAPSAALDYPALEKAWATAQALAGEAALLVGNVVGWQELGINPTTLSPEMLLCLARVASISETGVVITRLDRPGAGVVSFFSGVDVDAGEAEEEEFTWASITEMQWRIVSSSA